MKNKFLIAALIFFSGHGLMAQIGIGTQNPDRMLEVRSSNPAYIRVHSTSNVVGASGIELVRGQQFDTPVDWRVMNDGGIFKITSGNYKLNTVSTERLRITSGHNLGLGTMTPQSKLHIDNGEEASLVQDGYLMLGNSSGTNLIMDRNEIQARNNGNASDLLIQASGGDTYFNNNGGHMMLANGNGQFGIGTQSPQSRLGIEGNSWQVYLNNNGSNGGNDWYIGSTSNTWAAGDDQLVFSPTANSNNAKFRLRNSIENDGNTAPVTILSNGGQELLIDGNEIDAKNGPLYINHNSGHNTFISPSGGQVATGTSTPNAALTIYSESDALSIQRLGHRWDVYPTPPSGGNPWGSLHWAHNDIVFAGISGNTGGWFSLSDRRKKHNFRQLPDVLDRIDDFGVYYYSFKSDTAKRRYVGVMAQEVQPVFPEVVRQNEHQTGVAYGQLAVIVLKAIQEQQEIIRRLEAEIAGLEASKHESINSENQ